MQLKIVSSVIRAVEFSGNCCFHINTKLLFENIKKSFTLMLVARCGGSCSVTMNVFIFGLKDL